MIVVRRYVKGFLSPDIPFVVFGALLYEHLLETLRDNFTVTDKKTHAGGGKISCAWLDKDIKDLVERRNDLKEKIKIDFCLALCKKEYIVDNVSFKKLYRLLLILFRLTIVRTVRKKILMFLILFYTTTTNICLKAQLLCLSKFFRRFN